MASEPAPVIRFKARAIRIVIDDPEEAEHFLRGLIVARANNSSEYFQQIIDGVNGILEPYRMAVIEAQKTAVGTRRRVQVVE